MRKRCRFSTALKMFLLLFMTCVHFMAKAQTLVGQTLDAAPGDAFIYQSQSAPHYGIKWTSDTWAPGASTAWFSSYAGIKFFTAGTRKLSIDANGTTEILAPLIINPATPANNHILFRNNGTSLGILGSSGSLYGNPDDFGIYAYGSSNLEFSTGAAKRLVIKNTGNTGIGTDNPYAKLDVAGDIFMSLHNHWNQHHPSEQGSFKVGMKSGNTTDGFSGMQVTTKPYGEGNGSILQFFTWGFNTAFSREVMRITEEGNVAIGITSFPPQYKLAVAGKAIVDELKVKPHAAGWPDYVFKSTYKLTPLSEVEQFIKTHQHLPEVPSAKEVAANGIEVGANQALLLKKIEELTLHVIEVNKNVENLNNQMIELKKENLELKVKVVQQERVLNQYIKKI